MKNCNLRPENQPIYMRTNTVLKLATIAIGVCLMACTQSQNNNSASVSPPTVEDSVAAEQSPVENDSTVEVAHFTSENVEPLPPFDQWEAIEVPIENDLANAAVMSLTKQYSPYLIQEGETAKSLRQNFHFVHLNGDSLPDIIFTGWSGGEPQKTEIFYQEPDHTFSFQGRFYQLPYTINIKNNVLQEMKILDNGCCGSPYASVIMIKNMDQKLQPLYDSVYILSTYRKGKVIAPKRHTTTKKVTLRSAPFVDDTSYMGPHGNIGNQIGVLHAKTAFTTLLQLDYEEQNWQYIVTGPTNAIDRLLLYDSDTLQSKYVGWIQQPY